MPCKPIEALACDDSHTALVDGHHRNGYALGAGLGNLILWFIVIAVIVWFILWALRPRWVQRLTATGEPNGEVDPGRVLIGAIITALIIVVVIWLIRALVRW